MERNGETALEWFVGQLADLRCESTRRNGDMPRADLEAPGGVDDSDRAHDVGEVGQRFAHSHEDHVVDPFARRFLDYEQLLHDLARIQVPRKSFEPARAELAAIGAANLGRDANRPAVGAFAVERRRGRDEDRLDQASIAEAEEELSGRVLRSQHANGFEIVERKFDGERIAQSLGEIGHLFERADSLFVEPIDDLLRAVGAQVLAREVTLDLLKKKRVDRTLAGCRHTKGYVRRWRVRRVAADLVGTPRCGVRVAVDG